MQTNYIKSLALVLTAGVTLTSCFKKFDPDTYAPPLNIGGYSSSRDIAAANLKGYWAFNGGYTDSITGTAGTVVNAGDVSFVAGRKGQAVQVKGVGYINTNMAGMVAGLGSFTFSCWIQQPASLASAPTTYMPFSLNKAGYSWTQTKLFMLFEADDANNSFGKIGLSDQWFDKGRVWPKMLNDKWHQMVITYNGTNGALRVYINGTLLSVSSTFNFTPQANFGTADSFTLGGPDATAHAANGWMNSLSGNLDEFKVFNRVLTAEEVGSLYALEGRGL